ncbi:MAG: UbiD family decarboxylase [Desulfobacterota bacterium]|nr:UbiD family decarboxylase [Thermodesulfobacteriota bacterium]MDW8001869.1 UbiD family decarboxylase [Deltaproteobacteria bacterium]
MEKGIIRSLREYLDLLKRENLLISIRDKVKKEALPEIIQRLSRTGKALLFESLDGYDCRVVANLVPSQKVFNLLFPGENDPYSAFVERSSGILKKTFVQERGDYISINVTENDDVLTTIPILKHYESDSAPYITTAIVSSYDPETKVVGRGIHRMEYRGKNRFGISLVNPPLADIKEKYKLENKKMPVSVSIGVDPLTFMAMALKIPNNVDKIEVAGSLRGESIAVIRSFDSDIDVPYGTEFILEGVIHLEEEEKDGPLGEISGYYMTIERTPTVHINRISYRKDPIYHALLPTSLEADMYLTFVSKAHMEGNVKRLFPFVHEIVFLERTFGSSIVITTSPTERKRINNLLHFVLSFPMIKKAVIVDSDVDPYDLQEIEWAIVTRCFAKDDLILLFSMQGQPIDPEAKIMGGVTKIGINATTYGKEMEGRAVVKKGEKELVESIVKKYGS